jgi:hypothetical protein
MTKCLLIPKYTSILACAHFEFYNSKDNYANENDKFIQLDNFIKFNHI